VWGDLRSSKSKDLTGFRLYLAALASGFDRLWEVKMKKKWARSKLRVYGGKNRVFDKFFGRMARDVGPSATVYWGDASVNASMDEGNEIGAHFSPVDSSAAPSEED